MSKEKHTSVKISSTALLYPVANDAIYFNDLIGPFDPSSNGYHYTSMVICVLTRHTFCIPLKTKTASEVVQAYIEEVYTKFGESIKILPDNGTEFKNQLFIDVATQLGVDHIVYSPPSHPQSNGRIEGFHNFFQNMHV